MIYTLISYRANGADYCKGCLMSESDSAFDIDISGEANTIAEIWGAKLFEDHRRERGVCDWEVTLLVNGQDSHTDLTEYEEGKDPFETVRALAHQALDRKKKELDAAFRREQELLEREAEDAKKKAAEAKERRDQAEYRRLQAKYGGRA